MRRGRSYYSGVAQTPWRGSARFAGDRCWSEPAFMAAAGAVWATDPALILDDTLAPSESPTSMLHYAAKRPNRPFEVIAAARQSLQSRRSRRKQEVRVPDPQSCRRARQAYGGVGQALATATACATSSAGAAGAASDKATAHADSLQAARSIGCKRTPIDCKRSSTSCQRTA